MRNLQRIGASLATIVCACDGWRAPPSATPASSPAASDTTPQAIVGIRITLAIDRTLGSTTFQVDSLPPGDSAALEANLRDAVAAATKAGRDASTVTIDADRTVPWKDVVAAMNSCKQVGPLKIEFAFSGPEPK